MNPPESTNFLIQKPKVFISHSHKDQIYAQKILAWLAKAGFSPWASFEECSDKYRMEIDTALLECDVFLLIASKNSFESIEVRREINTAGSENKKITYYKLDESSHKLPGFFTLLSEKQYVQASKDNLELGKLALNIYETWDGNRDEQISQFRDNLISKCLANENENYLEWRERLWSLRLDSNNNPRKLSSFDRGILQQEAEHLGIIVSLDDENQAFSLNKLSFTNELRSLVAKQRIDKRMLIQIEKKRLECCVSKGLAVSILSERLSKIDYLNHIYLLKGAEKTGHWLVTEIRTMQGKNPINDSWESVNADRKDNPALVCTKESECFTFEHSIYSLERYIHDEPDMQMSIISISLNGNRILFNGLQGLKPFSFQWFSRIEISSGPGWIKLYQKDHETHIVIHVTNSFDFEALLKFLEKLVHKAEYVEYSSSQPKEMMQDIKVFIEENSDHEIKDPKAEIDDSGETIQSDYLGVILIMASLLFILIYLAGVGVNLARLGIGSISSFLSHHG
jgi:hypothetical protein